MVFTKYLWLVQCVCAKVNEAYSEQHIVTWGLNSFQFVLWHFFFFTQMIAVTNMWFGARITGVRPAEASGRMPESSSDQESLCVESQRASRGDRHKWERQCSWVCFMPTCLQGVLLSSKHPEIDLKSGYPLPLKAGELFPSLSCGRGIVLGVGLSWAPLRAGPSFTMTSQFTQNYLVLLKYIMCVQMFTNALY